MVPTALRANRAFTLVELSIVIVIIGLLAGGITAGKSLIHSAELRTVTADYNKFVAAENDFRSQYGAKPGDLTKAANYWGMRAGSGSSTGIDAACYNTLNVTTGTCNGNGDSFLSDNGVSSATSPEVFLFWQHLADAGFIEGVYTGSTSVAAFSIHSADNSPASRFGEVALWLNAYEPGPLTGAANSFDGQYGTEAVWVATPVGDAILTTSEASNIDTKIDDGKPATGIVYSLKGVTSKAPFCATTDVVATAAYDLTRNDKVCLLHMQLPI